MFPHELQLSYEKPELHYFGVWLSVALWGLIIIGLYFCSQYNFLFSHTLAEFFSIVIAGSVFVVAWNSRHSLQNNYLLIIGIGVLFVGLVDLVHTMAYKGLQVFPYAGANLPTQLWIAGRGLESLTFLVAPLFLGHRVRPGVVLGLYGLVTTFLLLAIFTWDIFPACYVEGQGLTRFKIISEYVICGILLGALALLWKHRLEFDDAVFHWLFWAIFLTIGSELAFTFYVGVYDLSNVIGHIMKILAFFMIYKALVETALVKPFDLLWRDLKQNEAELRRSEEQYRFLFENMLNGHAYCRMHFEQGKAVDFTYLNVNRAFESLTGLHDVVGKKVSEVIPGIQEDPDLLEIYGRVASAGAPERFEIHLKALNMWFEVSVYCPQKEYFVAVFDVITERKLAEEALRRSEARLRLAQEAAKAGTWEWDMRTNENYWSEEIWQLYGVEPHSCQPSYETWRQTIHPEDRTPVEQTVLEAARSGQN